LFKDKSNILDRWISDSKTVEILKKYNIKVNFFKNHFAVKMLDEIEKETFQDIYMHISILQIFILFFTKRGTEIEFDDVITLYMNLESILLENQPIENKDKITNIIEKKLDNLEKDMQMNSLFILDSGLIDDLDRLKDIRFSSSRDMDSEKLYELLDETFYKMTDVFRIELDKLLAYLDRVSEDDSTEKILEAIDKVIETFRLFSKLVTSAVFFPIISKSFDKLILFLESIDEEQLKDNSKKALIVTMLKGLNDDISNWIDIVFINKEADDVYYFDASFANNCLEIELQFDNKKIQKKKNSDIQELIKDEDDLMFFEP